MTDQIRTQPQPHSVAMRPIVRPLPMPEAESVAGRRKYAADMTAGFPLLVDASWYATYWFGELPAARSPDFGKAVRRIWAHLTAVVRVPARSARQDDRDLVAQPARI